MDRLILFDIDGTLTRTQHGYLPFNEAILNTFSVPGDIRSVVPDGNTDPHIVQEIFAMAKLELKIEDGEWARFAKNLHFAYAEAVCKGATTIHALPGALALLEVLSLDESFSQGVVTGNFELTAQVKLEAAGLHTYLCRGAYGSDSAHRPDLPRIAKERWERRTGKRLASERCVIIGDTPKDLAAARQNHMKCVLVGTGRYPVEELAYSEPDGCLPDLTDIKAVVSLLSSL
jgi:phosphoglycolate phosphatase-like HAD superfamily hydrolase